MRRLSVFQPTCSSLLVLSSGLFLSFCAHRLPSDNSVTYTTRVTTDAESQKAVKNLMKNGDADPLVKADAAQGGNDKELAGLEGDLRDQPAMSDAEDENLPQTGILRRELLKNPSVQNWIRFFSKTEKDRFQRHIDRAEPYRKVVQEILVSEGVPADIFYLAIIESGFRSEAKSSANAVGVWQFIAPTGTRYGLQVNRWVDERRDVIRATQAAAKYLKDLHNVFNSWELALAAYNTGEGRVLRAILRAKSRDFWTLLTRGVLPTETQDYVPKFVAAAYIYENAEKFGFELPEDEDHPRLSVVELPPRVRLLDIARISGINYDKLVFYNPHLLKLQTPPTSRTYKIWVPRQHQEKVIAALGRLPRGAQSLMMAESLGFSPQLAGVASKPRARDPFVRPSASQRSVASSSRVTSRKAPKINTTRKNELQRIYVKRGQNLQDLASTYGVNVDEIKKLNNLSSDRVLAGQGLIVPMKVSATGFSPKKVVRKAGVKASRVVKYRVRKGDSLASIADQFGVSVDQLRKDNRLRRQTLFAGETISIEGRGI